MIHDSIPVSLAKASPQELTSRLSSLLLDERRRLVDILWVLAELDSRRHVIALGYSSMFAYCTEALGFTGATAHRRVSCARLLRRFPIVADYLRDGRLNTTTLSLLDAVLTEQNHADLFERASRKTKEQVELLVATVNPRPPVPDRIQKLPSPRPEEQATSALPLSAPGADVDGPVAPASDVPATFKMKVIVDSATEQSHFDGCVPRRPERLRLEPIDAERYSVRFTANRRVIEKFQRVKAALSHVVPDGNIEDIFERCLDETLEVLARRKYAKRASSRADPPTTAAPSSMAAAPGAVDSPGTVDSPAAVDSTDAMSAAYAVEEAGELGDSAALAASEDEFADAARAPTAATRRAVWERDGGRCAFVGIDGKRCNSTHLLEFDHRFPSALGGGRTPEEMRIFCHVHNLFVAGQYFGHEYMARFTRRRRTDQRARDPTE